MSDKLNSWEFRIKAAQESLQRSRYAFVAATVISIAFAILSYNETLSWDRMYLMDHTPEDCEIIVNKDEKDSCKSKNEALEEALKKDAFKLKNKAFFKSWQDNMVMSNSILGIRIGSSDGYLLSGPVIIVLLTWSFYCVRRENHLIANLIMDALKTNDKSDVSSLKESVFYGVNSYTVFIIRF